MANYARLAGALLSLMLFAVSGVAYRDIFECVDKKIKGCLQYEMEIDPSWATRKNADGLGVLKMAIKQQDVETINTIIRNSAQVTRGDIAFAFKSLFNESHDRLTKDYQPRIKKNFSPVREEQKLIMAADKCEDQRLCFDAIAEVVDMFDSPYGLAKSIRRLYDNGFLSTRGSQILLSHYRKLFLQEDEIDKKQLGKIIAIMMDLDVRHQLLRLLMSAHEKLEKSANPATSPALHGENDYAQKVAALAFSVTEKTRTYFAQMTFKMVFQNLIYKNDDSVIANYSSFNDRLVDFVKSSILLVEDAKTRQQRYDFWLDVCERVHNIGDLSSAFYLTTALTNTAVEKAVGEIKSERLPLAELGHNFKSYYDAIEKLQYRFFLPSLQAELRNLTMLREGEIVSNKGDAIELNIEKIGILAKARKRISPAFLFAKKWQFSAPFEVYSLIERLSDLEEEEDGISDLINHGQEIFPEDAGKNKILRLNRRPSSWNLGHKKPLKKNQSIFKSRSKTIIGDHDQE